MKKSANLLLRMFSLLAAVSLAGCAVVPYQTPAGWLFAGRSVGTACMPSCRQMPCHGYHATMWSAWPEWCPSVETMLAPDELVGEEEPHPELLVPPPAETPETPPAAEQVEEAPTLPPPVVSEPSSEEAPAVPPPVELDQASDESPAETNTDNPPPVTIDGEPTDTAPSEAVEADEPELPAPPSSAT